MCYNGHMGNTVGSLSQRQKSILIGSLLGDAYLRKMPGRSDAFFEFNHSYKAKDYVDWKYQELKNFVKSKPKKRAYSNREAYRFFTVQRPEFTKIYESFYRDSRKVIDRDLQLNALVLAVWFMDDGSVTSKSDVYLNTQQFSMKDQKFLLHVLRRDLGIRARLNKDKKYYRIRILKESLPTFVSFVRRHVIDSMRYKLDKITIFDDDPVETSRNKRGSTPNAEC